MVCAGFIGFVRFTPFEDNNQRLFPLDCLIKLAAVHLYLIFYRGVLLVICKGVVFEWLHGLVKLQEPVRFLANENYSFISNSTNSLHACGICR